MKPLMLLKTVFLLVIVFLTSCTKTETNYYPESGKTLVIVSDNDPSSDLIVGLLGAVRASDPGIEVQFYSSKAFDIIQGSYLLYVTMMNYPQGTYIAGIIEPGASSKRIVYQASNEFIIAPDNTLSTRILNYYPSTQCYFIENPQVLEGAQPETLSIEEFYKRAILSLVSGTPPSSFGPVCPNPRKFPVQDPVISGDTIKGEILFTDNFGNCVTNIPQSLVTNIPAGSVLNLTSDTTHLSITMGINYSSVPVGSNVCFMNSSLRLELAINYGNFSEKYNLAAGSKVALKKM